MRRTGRPKPLKPGVGRPGSPARRRRGRGPDWARGGGRGAREAEDMLSPRRKGRCGRSPPAPEKSQRSPAAREPGGPAMEEGSGFRLSAECLDEPPNSRVFVVLGKDTGEALIRERFSPFGDIQNIWLLRDKRTNESRGIAFIKFARSSQACRAMEEMHGRSLVPDTKPIKVLPPGRAVRPPSCPGAGPGASQRGPAGCPPFPFPAWRPRRAAGLGRCAPSLTLEGGVGLRGGNRERQTPSVWGCCFPFGSKPGAFLAVGLAGLAGPIRRSCGGSHPRPKFPRMA